MDSTIPMAGKRKRITLPTSAKPFLREFRGISAWAWGFLVLSWFKKAPAFYAMQLFTIFRQHATSRLVGVPSAVIQWSNEPMSSFAKNRQLVLKLVMSLGRSTIATSDVAIQTIAKGRFSVAQVKTCQASQDMSRPNDVFGQAMSCGPIWCPKVSIEWLKASKIKSNIFAQLASNPQLSISGFKNARPHERFQVWLPDYAERKVACNGAVWRTFGQHQSQWIRIMLEVCPLILNSTGWWLKKPWKMMEFVNGVGMTSHEMENNPFMFQTTNQRLLTITNH